MSSGTEVEKERTKISVAMGDFRVELDGTHRNVEKLMGKPLYQFIKGLQNVVGAIPPMERVEKEEKAPPAEYPPPISKTASLADAIKTLLNSDWGKTPRAFGEIMTALKTSGIYYPKTTFGATLNHLTKSGALRRMGKRGSFKYVIA